MFINESQRNTLKDEEIQLMLDGLQVIQDDHTKPVQAGINGRNQKTRFIRTVVEPNERKIDSGLSSPGMPVRKL